MKAKAEQAALYVMRMLLKSMRLLIVDLSISYSFGVLMGRKELSGS